MPNRRRARQPTVLVYGHYDVQPPDPLDEWISPPVRADRSRRQHLRPRRDRRQRADAHAREERSRPGSKPSAGCRCNLKFVIEGEEEVGSENLDPFVERTATSWPATSSSSAIRSQFAPGMPAITYGLRGIAYFELRCTGPSRTCIPARSAARSTNPAMRWPSCSPHCTTRTAACKCPASTTTSCRSPTENGSEFARCRLRRSRVHAIGRRQRTCSARTASHPRTPLGPPHVRHQRPDERLSRRRAKTILPARASAKFSFRLVPNQDPQEDR